MTGNIQIFFSEKYVIMSVIYRTECIRENAKRSPILEPIHIFRKKKVGVWDLSENMEKLLQKRITNP